MKNTLLIVVVLLAVGSKAQKFEIEENTVKPKITFTLKKGGLTSTARLSLHVEDGKDFSKVAVLSSVSSSGGNTLSLEPNVDLAFGTKYKVQVEGLGKEYAKVFSTPDQIKVPGELGLDFVFPLVVKDTVPANNMLYYLQFNTPMQQDQLAYMHVDLIDDKGEVIDRPWRERTFWMNDGKMMTLMVHPAKLKRGIKERVGTAIHENRTYTIRIKEGLRDIYNRPVTGKREIILHAVTRDTLMPKILAVHATPEADKFTDIKVKFSEMMDYGSVRSYVKVVGNRRKELPVTVSYLDKTDEWIIRPNIPWSAGIYELQFINALMDVAGNQLNRPFETEEMLKGQDDVFQSFTFIVK